MMDYNDGLLPEPCLRMDTHFGDDYESVEFGDGTGYVKAAPMLARLGALHVELGELRNENAKLREDLEFERSENGLAREFLNRIGQKCGTKDCPSLVAYVTKLEAENAKLRELVKDMYGFIQSMDEDCGDVIFSDCFDYCKHEAADDGCRKIGKCWYDRRMHELGVEVDAWASSTTASPRTRNCQMSSVPLGM